jgi:hypothetical protein
MRSCNVDELTRAELATAAIDIDRALELEPQLCDLGLGVPDSPLLTPAERIDWFRHERERIREPQSLAQSMAARSWLRRFSKTKALNRRGTSCGLKHYAEDDIGYVTNGVFIAAAIAEGFTARRTGPNAWFNISTEAWRSVERSRDDQRRREMSAGGQR